MCHVCHHALFFPVLSGTNAIYSYRVTESKHSNSSSDAVGKCCDSGDVWVKFSVTRCSKSLKTVRRIFHLYALQTARSRTCSNRWCYWSVPFVSSPFHSYISPMPRPPLYWLFCFVFSRLVKHGETAVATRLYVEFFGNQ